VARQPQRRGGLVTPRSSSATTYSHSWQRCDGAGRRRCLACFAEGAANPDAMPEATTTRRHSKPSGDPMATRFPMRTMNGAAMEPGGGGLRLAPLLLVDHDGATDQRIGHISYEGAAPACGDRPPGGGARVAEAGDLGLEPRLVIACIRLCVKHGVYCIEPLWRIYRST